MHSLSKGKDHETRINYKICENTLYMYTACTFQMGLKVHAIKYTFFSKGWLDPNYILLYFLEIAPQRKLIAKIRLP